MRWVEVVRTKFGYYQVHYKKKVWRWTFTLYCETKYGYSSFDNLFASSKSNAHNFKKKEDAISMARYVESKFLSKPETHEVVYSSLPERVNHEEADVVLKRMLAADEEEDIDTVAECLLKLKQIHKL